VLAIPTTRRHAHSSSWSNFMCLLNFNMGERTEFFVCNETRTQRSARIMFIIILYLSGRRSFGCFSGTRSFNESRVMRFIKKGCKFCGHIIATVQTSVSQRVRRDDSNFFVLPTLSRPWACPQSFTNIFTGRFFLLRRLYPSRPFSYYFEILTQMTEFNLWRFSKCCL